MSAESRYPHIIWDWNGTLFEDAWLCVEIMNGLLAERSLPALTIERYQEILDFPIINYYARLGFDFAAEPFEVPATEFIEEYYRRWPECGLAHGAAATLRAIRDLGCRQSILSAAPQVFLEQAVCHYGISDFFAEVVGLEDHYARGKVENGRRLVAESGSAREGMFLVGDTVHDLEVARAIGVDCVLVPGSHCSRARLSRSGGMILDSLGEVLRLLT